jgi:hypothetical protein
LLHGKNRETREEIGREREKIQKEEEINETYKKKGRK